MPGERKYGMDHDFYEWSPVSTRSVLKWPDGARVALCVIVDLEHYDWEMPADAPVAPGPVGGLGIGSFPDPRSFSHHEYGNRVGIFRVLSVLDKYGIKPTIAIDAVTAENYAFLIQECQKRDAEFIGHGTTVRHIIHAGMSEEEERKYIHDSLEAVAKATGKRPVGWLSPEYSESMRTPNLLASEGLRYICDWPNDEQPYQMTMPEGEVYCLPTHLILDDLFTSLNRRISVIEYGKMIEEVFDGLYESGAENGRVMVLNLHPWFIGQPFRIKYLDQALGYINKHGAVWKATGQEIIDWYASHR